MDELTMMNQQRFLDSLVIGKRVDYKKTYTDTQIHISDETHLTFYSLYICYEQSLILHF